MMQGESPLNAGFLAQAQAEAQRFGHKYVRTEHLLLALLAEPDSGLRQRLDAAGLDYAGFSALVAGLNCPVCGAEATLELSAGAKRALEAARHFASGESPDSVHLLRGILQVSPLVRELLADAGYRPIVLTQD